MQQARIGVDTGGTFTDILLEPGDGGPVRRHKLLSTPGNPAAAVIAGVVQVLELLAESRPAEAAVIHGSTIATNALLEGKGARAAFITTAGFADLLFLARQNRPQLYDLHVRQHAPPLETADCFELEERIGHDGRVITPLGDEEVARLVSVLRDSGVSACCVCLLHSYANPAHEQMVAAAIRQALPELHLTVSSELLPEFREYERAATCLANSVVGPVMSGYLAELSTSLPTSQLRIMASHGGSLPVAPLRRMPVQTVLSGPAGGLRGAITEARRDGVDNFVSFDMGGTSTDVALCDGQFRLTTEFSCAGLPIRVPVADIHTVGAGGGSLAWLDSGGALHVGPQSMGADPGPACYGRQSGRLAPTVTDAHVVLGHIPPWLRLAGSLALDPDAAFQAVSQLAAQCRLGLYETAEGILRVAESTMDRAIKQISVERGHDVRRFVLLSFGGAGGLHAARLASGLGMAQVLVPANPGLLSALGMLGAGPLYQFTKTVMHRISHSGTSDDGGDMPAHVEQAFAALEGQAAAALGDEGIEPGSAVIERKLDLRYVGQSYELSVGAGAEGYLRAFEAEHNRLYGYTSAERDIEVVTARVFASAEAGSPPGIILESRASGDWRDTARQGAIFVGGQEVPCWFLERDELRCGDAIDGPAVILEFSATTLVPRGWRLSVSQTGALSLAAQAEVHGG